MDAYANEVTKLANDALTEAEEMERREKVTIRDRPT